MNKNLLIILFFLVTARIFSIEYIAVPEKTAPGSCAAVIYVSDEFTAEECTLADEDKNIKTSEFIQVHEAGKAIKLNISIAQMPVSYSVKPGNYKIISGNTQGGKTSEDITVEKRDFIEETIHLDARNTAIRTDTSDRRREESVEISEILKSFDSKAIYHTGTFAFPLREDSGWKITSFYADRRTYIYSDGVTAYSTHLGWDFGGTGTGADVLASVYGKVVLAKERIVTGNTVVIEFWPGAFLLYYHMDLLTVQQGDLISAGDKIGTVGMTGLATGPHLHWEMRLHNVPVDPMIYLDEKLIDKSLLMSIIEERFERRG